MSYLNPLIGPVAQGPQAQRAAAAEKERQIARAQAVGKNSAAGGDRFEHAVESADALIPVDEHPSHGGRQQQQHPQQRREDDSDPATPADRVDEPHLDVTA